eukprot:gene45191-42232_t
MRLRLVDFVIFEKFSKGSKKDLKVWELVEARTKGEEQEWMYQLQEQGATTNDQWSTAEELCFKGNYEEAAQLKLQSATE